MNQILKTSMRKEIIDISREPKDRLLILRQFLESLEEPLYARSICNLCALYKPFYDNATYQIQEDISDKWFTCLSGDYRPTITLDKFLSKYMLKPKIKGLK